MDKNEDEADEHFKWLVEHVQKWEPQEPSRSQLKSKSINQLKSEDDLPGKYERLAHKFQELESRENGNNKNR